MLGLLACFVFGPAVAGPPSEHAVTSPPSSDEPKPALSGELFVTYDDSHVVAGGPREGRSASRALLDAGLEFDAESAFGLRGLSVRLGAQALAGELGTALTGDVQVFDNIDAQAFVGVSELWLQQQWQDGRISLKIGRMDANSSFATVEDNALTVKVRARRHFVHSSMGFSPTMLRFASYPNQALGAVLDVRLHRRVRLATGIFDGSLRPSLASTLNPPVDAPLFSSLFAVSELGVGWALGAGRGNISLGGWILGDAELDAKVAGGPYLVASQTLWREAGTLDQGLGLFAQYAYTNSVASQVEHHAGGGLTWVGAIAERDADVVGLGASWVRVHLDRGHGNETALEAFYRISLHPHLWVQPDLQILVSPGGDGPSMGVLTFRVAFDV